MRVVIATLLLAGSAWSVAAQPKPVNQVEGITEYRLANGLQVLLAPDDSKPTTTVNLTVRVGSRHENYGETGMAHLLEHMVFKGTPKTSNAWAEFSKRGLRANGSTWLDRTNYYASFAANDANLRWYLGWQADAMVNSFIAKRDLDTEMTVVRNEMEMGENSPGRILFEKVQATMYQWHNYGKSTIGARADVENVDIGRLQAFYRTYYQPDNATLIVSGKFDPARVLQWVQQSFGAIPKPRRALPRLYTIDPVQDGERSITLRRASGTPMLMLGYHLPPGAHPDFAAVELLSLIVADSPSGRAHKRLVEPGLVSGVFAEMFALADPGFALFGAQLAAGQDLSRASNELVAVIEGLANTPPDEEEFKRAQVKWLKNWDQQYTNPETVGVALSETIAQGDWRLLFLLRDRVRALKREDLQRVAQERFVAANRTLASYLPTEKPQRAPLPERVDVAREMQGFKPQAAATVVPPFDTAPANIDAKTQRATLPNGLKLALLSKPTRGQAVRLAMQVRVGDERSLQGQREVSEFVAAMLDKGANGLTRQQVQDRLDALKAEVGFSSSGDVVTVSMLARRDTIADAVVLLGRLLREPAFPESALDELKRQALSQLQTQRDDPEAIVENQLARRGNPYPRGDLRYARSFDEQIEDAKVVTVEQLKAFHARHYGGGQAQLAVVGDFDAAAVQRALADAFGTWVAASPPSRVARPLFAVAAGRDEVRTPDKQNAVLGVQLRWPVSENDAVYPALALANYILGYGGDSRLWKRIREREGLSYGVWSTVDWGDVDVHSVWSGAAIFAPTNRDKVEAAFKEEVARALKDGFTDAEVVSARQALLNFRRLARAQDERLAQGWVRNLELNRTFEFAAQVDQAISRLSASQVNQALRTHLKPDAMAFVLAGDFKQP